jgi:hypothetical protein
MQDFVEKFIAEKKAELGDKCAELLAPNEEKAKREREERLIRLGMCQKEYSESQVYSENYPYQERKTGRFFRYVAFSVTDEEYAAICRYDNSAMELRPKKATDRLYGKGAKNYRRTAALRFLLGFLVSILAGVILYLLESEYLFLSIGVVVLGVLNAHLAATQTYMAGRSLEKTEQLIALSEKEDQ